MSALLRSDRIEAWLQPVVELSTGGVVAMEALARGPVGALHLPAALFERADREGLTAELEWACRAAAYRAALEARLPQGVAVFVNVEPAQLGAATPAAIASLEGQVRAQLPVVLELTERDLVRRPAAVLKAVYAARARGWGIALDDVGAEPASLALMPVVRPDVVKLDMALVQRPPTVETGRIASAVAAYAEEAGASVLAEGIETELHLERAIALGATLGQGWLFGRPQPPETISIATTSPGLLRLRDADAPLASTPFDLVAPHIPTRIARKSHLLAMSHHLERQAGTLSAPPLLLAAFQDARHFTPATARRYREYARHSSLVAAFGFGLTQEPERNVRGAALDRSDPLAREWTVVVLSPHFAGALIARDLGDMGPDTDRRFEFAVTHRRDHVTTAARCLIERIVNV